MVGIGAGEAQDAAGAARIGQATAHRLGKLCGADVERAGSDKQDPAARSDRGGEACELAVAAQCDWNILARSGKGGRISHHDVEAFAASGEPRGLGKDFGAAKRAGLTRPVSLGRLGGQVQCRFGAVDTEDRGGPARAACTAKPPVKQ